MACEARSAVPTERLSLEEPLAAHTAARMVVVARIGRDGRHERVDGCGQETHEEGKWSKEP